MSLIYLKPRFGNLRVFDVNSIVNTNTLSKNIIQNREGVCYRVSSLQYNRVCKKRHSCNISLIESLNTNVYNSDFLPYVDIDVKKLISFIDNVEDNGLYDKTFKITACKHNEPAYEYIQAKKNICILNLNSKHMRIIFRIKSGEYGLSIPLVQGHMVVFNNNISVDNAYLHYYSDGTNSNSNSNSCETMHFYF